VTEVAAPIDPSTRADVATRAVLAGWADAIRARTQEVVDTGDVEALHQLRVAIRRSRSLLGRSRDVLPRRVVGRYGRQLKWAQQVTGALRDLDVHLEELPGYRAMLVPELAAELDPLEAWLSRQRDAARRLVIRTLQGKRWRKLVDGWTAEVASPPAASPRAERARQPIGEVARRQVRKLHRRVIRHGRGLDASSPPADVHELRKRCKKLRYVLEAWRPVLDADAVDKVVKDLKALQALLGTYQDQEVHGGALAAIAAEMDAAGACATPTILAIGALVEKLREAQAATRAAFDDTFAAFDTKKVERHLDRLLA
jgi:CHAD domain-containing protein